MKKNMMMRMASVLLIAVLMSTCAISGTFAKYVTSDSATDTARVAKFGVVVTAEGSLFSKTYVEQADGNVPGDADLTVRSSDEDKLVAPGTQNDEGITFEVTGTPEVSVSVSVVIENVSEVFLKANASLPDMTTGANDIFENDVDYYPVKFTLTQDKGLGVSTLVDGGKLADVETALEALSATYGPNTDLAKEIGTLKLTWKWDFDNAGAGTYDKQDTLLGDLAAGTTLVPATTLTPGTDYNLNTEIEIKITVTQID